MAAPINSPSPHRFKPSPLTHTIERLDDGIRYHVARGPDHTIEEWTFCIETIEDMVGLLEAVQISVIAERLTAQIMQFLDIDITRDVKLDLPYSDTVGNTGKLGGDLYNPNTPLFKTLRLKIERALRGFVADPQTHEFNLNILLLDPERSCGLLNRIEEPELKGQLDAALQQAKHVRRLDTFKLTMELQINLDRSKEAGALYFDQILSINDQKAEETTECLNSMELHGEKRALRFIPKS